MRGAFVDQGKLFSYISPEARVPANHPLRKIRELVHDVLRELNRSLSKLYASDGRPSIPPEQLLSALLLQVFYSLRSERQLMEQLDYNLLYRWFVGLSPDDPVWDPTVFTKNRDRLQNGDAFAKFMSRLLNHPQVRPLLSDEHFSVDGTLIEAWASHKSFRPTDGSGDADGGANFHGQKRKNDTHASTTDPDSRLYRKAAGREAKLCYMRHVTMENRHGLAVAGMVTLATGTAERRASETMLKAKARQAGRRITVGEDKAYDVADHVANLPPSTSRRMWRRTVSAQGGIDSGSRSQCVIRESAYPKTSLTKSLSAIAAAAMCPASSGRGLVFISSRRLPTCTMVRCWSRARKVKGVYLLFASRRGVKDRRARR